MQGSTRCPGQPAVRSHGEHTRAAGSDEFGTTREPLESAGRVQSASHQSVDDVQRQSAAQEQPESAWTIAERCGGGGGPISDVQSEQPVRNRSDHAAQLVAQLLETVWGAGKRGKYI